MLFDINTVLDNELAMLRQVIYEHLHKRFAQGKNAHTWCLMHPDESDVAYAPATTADLSKDAQGRWVWQDENSRRDDDARSDSSLDVPIPAHPQKGQPPAADDSDDSDDNSENADQPPAQIRDHRKDLASDDDSSDSEKPAAQTKGKHAPHKQRQENASDLSDAAQSSGGGSGDESSPAPKKQTESESEDSAEARDNVADDVSDVDAPAKKRKPAGQRTDPDSTGRNATDWKRFRSNCGPDIVERSWKRLLRYEHIPSSNTIDDEVLRFQYETAIEKEATFEYKKIVPSKQKIKMLKLTDADINSAEYSQACQNAFRFGYQDPKKTDLYHGACRRYTMAMKISQTTFLKKCLAEAVEAKIKEIGANKRDGRSIRFHYEQDIQKIYRQFNQQLKDAAKKEDYELTRINVMRTCLKKYRAFPREIDALWASDDRKKTLREWTTERRAKEAEQAKEEERRGREKEKRKKKPKAGGD